MQIVIGDLSITCEVPTIDRGNPLRDGMLQRVQVGPPTYDLNLMFEIVQNDGVDELHQAVADMNPMEILRILSQACTQRRMAGLLPSQVLGDVHPANFDDPAEDVTCEGEVEPGCTDQPTGRRALDVGS